MKRIYCWTCWDWTSSLMELSWPLAPISVVYLAEDNPFYSYYAFLHLSGKIYARCCKENFTDKYFCGEKYLDKYIQILCFLFFLRMKSLFLSSSSLDSQYAGVINILFLMLIIVLVDSWWVWTNCKSISLIIKASIKKHHKQIRKQLCFSDAPKLL